MKRSYKEIFIDPGVYDLTKSDEYSWYGKIDIKEFLNGLPDNCYFSFDYPCDMNPKYTDRFLDRSWFNAIKYCAHPQYIVTVQSKFNDYWSFKKWFDRYNDLPIVSGIMGLGNICRIHHLTEFIKHALGYAFKNCNHPRIHIYGLALRIIPYANNLAEKYGIKLSTDSTKWTYPVNKELKDKVGRGYCRGGERQMFFEEYMKEIEKRGVMLE